MRLDLFVQRFTGGSQGKAAACVSFEMLEAGLLVQHQGGNVVEA